VRLREAVAVLGERDFRNLFLARTTSFLGSSFAPVALAFAILDDLDALGSFVAIPIGMTVVGPIAEVIGVGSTLALASAIAVVATALVLLSRDVRTLRRVVPEATPEPEPALATR
jgi:hypothetical protein